MTLHLEMSKTTNNNPIFLSFPAEYPFINYFVIHKTRDEAAAIFKEARSAAYDAFAPEKLGYTCGHTFEKFDEVATIARFLKNQQNLLEFLIKL